MTRPRSVRGPRTNGFKVSERGRISRRGAWTRTPPAERWQAASFTAVGTLGPAREQGLGQVTAAACRSSTCEYDSCRRLSTSSISSQVRGAATPGADGRAVNTGRSWSWPRGSGSSPAAPCRGRAARVIRRDTRLGCCAVSSSASVSHSARNASASCRPDTAAYSCRPLLPLVTGTAARPSCGEPVAHEQRDLGALGQPGRRARVEVDDQPVGLAGRRRAGRPATAGTWSSSAARLASQISVARSSTSGKTTLSRLRRAARCRRHHGRPSPACRSGTFFSKKGSLRHRPASACG